MFTKKSHQDVKKSSIKIQDSKKDSATRLKHLKIVLENFNVDEAKAYFEANFSHVYFILYDNFIQAENNLRQRVHKAGKEELEGALSLLEKVLCLLPELIGRRWQLHSLSRVFAKLLHTGNSYKLRTEAIKYFLLWYQALGDNATVEVHKMFASLVPGFPEPNLTPSGTPIRTRSIDLLNTTQDNELTMDQLMHHPNFNSDAKKVVVETQPGFMGKLANVSASIFHDTNALNPVQTVEIQPLLPGSASERISDETVYFLDMLLESMANSVTKIHWKDRSHGKCMRSFAFLLEKFKLYYLPVICPQFDYKNSLYKPNLDLPVHHNVLEDDYVNCRVALIKWVGNYVHWLKKQGPDQPNSLLSSGCHQTPTPATSMQHEEETSFTVGNPSESSRASSHDSSLTPHHSLESGPQIIEQLCPLQVVRDVLCASSREHVDFTIEVLRQAFLLPFSQAAAIRRVIALYKDWIQMNMSEVPPFLLEPPVEPPEIVAPPRRLRNDSYLGAIARDHLMVRAGMQNVLQVFMSSAANVFVGSGGVAPPGGLSPLHLLEEQTDTCKRVLNIYRYMVMHVNMDANSWEQLLLVLLQITSLVLNKVPAKRKQETLGGLLAPAIFQTLIVTWIKANLNVSVRSDLWHHFVDLLGRLTHWEELINEWAKTMETLTRVLGRHVYGLELGERDPRRPHKPAPPRPTHTLTPATGKSPKVSQESHPRKESAGTRRALTRTRSEPHLNKRNTHQGQEENTETVKESPPRLVTRKWCSLDSLRHTHNQEYRDSANGSRSPSPAPSSGVESGSIKDSPLQIDLAGECATVEWSESESLGVGGDGVGVVLGGAARGWTPGVAAVLWRRMLAALGNPNRLTDPHHHHQLYSYLLRLNHTLLKISANQSLNGNTEIHVPFNLFAGWCLEAEVLPPAYRAGKLVSLRLLCESVQAQASPGGPTSCNNRPHLPHLPYYLRALHHGLTGEDRSVVDVVVQTAAPRLLSLCLEGHSLLLLDFVHAATVVLNSNDMSPTCPRTAAVSFLGSLLSLPTALMSAPMLKPYPDQYNTVSCPDLKEHVVNVLVRVCRHEGCGRARVCGAVALSTHLAHTLATHTHDHRTTEHVTCLLQMLMIKNKNIAKVVSDSLVMLADYTDRIIEQYPGLVGKIIRWICACLASVSSTSSRESVKPLAGSLLLCLAEFAVRTGPQRLMDEKINDHSLLLIIFKVLYALMKGVSGTDIEGLNLPLNEDFNPEVQVDNLGTKNTPTSTIDVKLWAQTICTQLVRLLGHWPLWSACQISSTVSEAHDGTAHDVLTAPHIQFLKLSDHTLASFIELPAIHITNQNTTPGLTTSDRQVRVVLRDIAGKACWDTSALHYDPPHTHTHAPPPRVHSGVSGVEHPLCSLPPPLSPDLLPTHTHSPNDKHQLDHVLAYIGRTSPEVTCGRRLEEAGPSPLPASVEDELLAALVQHRNAERHYTRAPTPVSIPTEGEECCPNESEFGWCRRLVAQLGVTAAPRRHHTQLLHRNDRLLRELRNLDAQSCRETHKIAVIYVAKGQETRNEILSNRCGSLAYEAFLAALAWEVELESHVGFAGGLRAGAGGVSAPYLGTLTLEMLCHVATRMPADTHDNLLNKTRHLGNDEVHVVWSEHWREYKRDTLPTQFCDVLICLYPLPAGLLRCTVSRKPNVSLFGPIWEESVVPMSCAAALVRAACACGGRAVRATLPLFQHAYCERARSLAAVTAQHTRPATAEDFLMAIRDPGSQGQLHTHGPDRNSGRLASALIDGGNSWSNTETNTVSPRPTKRIGPFKRPPASPPVPLTANRKNR